jgi:hypothetical protein
LVARTNYKKDLWGSKGFLYLFEGNALRVESLVEH